MMLFVFDLHLTLLSLTSYFLFVSLKNFIRPKLLRPIFNQPNDLVLGPFRGNIIFTFTSDFLSWLHFLALGLLKFHLFFNIFGLIGFGLFYTGLVASPCLVSCAKKFMCLCVL